LNKSTTDEELYLDYDAVPVYHPRLTRPATIFLFPLRSVDPPVKYVTDYPQTDHLFQK
jgi:hypothetical protein